MKFIYIILFFADTFLVMVLAYLFFQLMDNGMTTGTFAMMLFAIVICIFMLIYFLFQYIKIPSSENRKDF